MANFTVSINGGNINVGTTYVGGIVPSSTDSIIFTATSGQLTVNTPFTISSIDFTNYVNTLTMSAVLTVNGSITLVAVMTITGISNLNIGANGTLTSNGKTWPNSIIFTGGTAFTWADNWTISGGLTSSSTATTYTGAVNINVGGSLLINNNVQNGVSAPTIILNGTGTWSTGASLGNLRLNLTINTVGTITISGNVNYCTGTITYIAGTIVNTGSTLSLIAVTSPTLNTGVMSWNNITNSIGFNITSNLNINGNFSGGLAITGAFTMTISGNFTVSSNLTGTCNILLNGTGTWLCTGGNQIYVNCTINTAGTITLGATVAITQGVFTYTAGTIVNTGSTLSLFSIGGTITLNTSGMSWNNVNTIVNAGINVTLTSNFNVAGNMSITQSIIINGLFNVNVGGNLSINASTSGTSTIILNGTGTWSSTAILQNNLTINSVGTITLSGTINYSNGTLTYTSGTTICTSAFLQITGNPTLNLNGSSSPSATATSSTGINIPTITFGGSTIYTLTSPLCCLTDCQISLNSTTINGSIIYINGNLSGASSNAASAGTTLFLMQGTGTWSGNYTFKNNITFNTTGTITISGTVALQQSTLTYIAGTINTTGSTLNVTIVSLNLDGMSLNNLTWINFTTTLLSNCTCTGSVTINGASAALTGSFLLNVGGNLTLNSTLATGTSTIVMNGTGTLSGSGTLNTNLTFNTAGTITISGTINYGANILTYTSGTMIVTGSLLSVLGGSTLNTSSMFWNNITLLTGTTTLTSVLNISGNLTGSGTNTINGLFNVNVGGNFNCSISVGTSTVVMNGTGSVSSAGQMGINLTFNTVGTITVNSFQIGAGLTITYLSGTINCIGVNNIVSNSTTLNTNGMIWNTLSGVGSFILSSNCSCVNLTSSGGTLNINGLFNMNISGNLTLNAVLQGSSTIIMNGTGIWSGNFNLFNILTFNTTGTITVSGNVKYTTGTLTYIAGTVITTGSILTLNTCTLNTNGIVWESVYLDNATVTNNSILTLTTTLYVSTAFACVLNGSNVFIGGSINTSVKGLSGTALLTLNGTGVLVGDWGLSNNLTINTNGTITISTSTNYVYVTGTFTYIAGTVITTNSNFVIAACTLNTNGIFFNNVSVTGTTNTCTLQSDLNILNIFQTQVSQFSTFNGSNINLYGTLSLTGDILGTTNIVFKGNNCSWLSNSNTNVANNVTFDSGSTTTLDKNIYYKTGIFNYNNGSGKVKALSTTLNITASCSLNRINVINFLAVIITTGTITSDSWFSGTPSTITSITAISSNYNVIFSTNNQQFSRFIKMSGCTLNQPCRLIISGPNANKGSNIGVIFGNSLSNGFSQNNRILEHVGGFNNNVNTNIGGFIQS